MPNFAPLVKAGAKGVDYLVDALRNSGAVLDSINPTGSVFVKYDPSQRATATLGKNLTTLDKTMGVTPEEMVTIYRGVPSGVSKINAGDFVTTNQMLAKDYAGGGKVVAQKVPANSIIDDITEPLGEEYIYRPFIQSMPMK